MKALPVLAFLVTAVIGWNFAGIPARSAKSTDSAAAVRERGQRPERHVRKAAGPDGEAGQRLAAIRASRDPAERMRATIDLASTLPISEFTAWIDGSFFDLRGGAELTVFSKIFEERWKNEDPEGFLAWATKSSPQLASEMLAGWAENDPQRVLDFYKNHPNDVAEMRSLSAIALKNPALALQRMQELLAAGTSLTSLSSHTGSLFAALADKSPAALDAALDSLPAKLKLQAESILVGRKMKTSLDDEFLKLQSHPDGIAILSRILDSGDSRDSGDAIHAKILANLADLPALWRAAIASNSYSFMGGKNAALWITADLEGSGFTAEQAKQMRSQALDRLYNQPEVALKLLPEVEMDDDSRKNLLSNIFSNLNGDETKAAALLALLPNEEDRKFALAMASPREQTEHIFKINNPADWLTSLAAFDPKTEGSTYAYISASEEWDSTKITALTQQFNALPDDTKRSIAQNLVRDGYSDKSPLEAEAIRFLLSDPAAPPSAEAGDTSRNTPENKNIQLASRYVGKLAQNDPTAAGDWIQTLPEGQPKLWAAKNLQSLWSQYDPVAADHWLKSLPTATQTQIKSLAKKPGN
ncbi:MAG: hypothetical protein ABIS50_00130 [Luteolibacter sp.]|uniref:hypothetical protein n=1 Tax=Luteolibacter sp. TaxID=1962973 RepID=UPI0032667017